MQNKVKKPKKQGRTVYLLPEQWEYLDALGEISDRKHSEEISQALKIVRAVREQSTEAAFKLVSQNNPLKN